MAYNIYIFSIHTVPIQTMPPPLEMTQLDSTSDSDEMHHQANVHGPWIGLPPILRVPSRHHRQCNLDG